MDLHARMAAGPAPKLTIDSLWVLDDGRAGHLAQSLGVAEALGIGDPEVVRLRPRFKGRLAGLLPMKWAFESLPEGPYPQVAVATGTRGGRVLKWLKGRQPGLFAVQVLGAGNVKDYDVVVMPVHDRPRRADNVCLTTGALSRVNPARLQAEGQRWEKRLGHCPAPRLAVMVGGSSRHARFGAEEAKRLAKELLAAAKASGMSLLVSASRRTGEAVTAALKKQLEGQKDIPVHFWEPEDITSRDNPYFAYLALAQAVVVTGDSISMISEAATAARPVYVWAGDGVKRMPAKFKRFLDTMEKQGRVRLWDGKMTLRAPAAGLMDNALVAGFIRARLMRRKG